jgi:hypothetical protein
VSKKTENYGLILEDDAQTKFKNWREAINGTTNSNFIEVDRILADKGDKSKSIECTLIASSWVGVDAPFTQELAVDGLGAVQNGDISVAHSATFEQREAARDAKLCVTGQADGKLIISADGEMPEVDIPVAIIFLG